MITITKNDLKKLEDRLTKKIEMMVTKGEFNKKMDDLMTTMDEIMTIF
ncbi:MAG TPA: hypothetical protein PKV21_09560 [bacterium]|nr:hypothetical protein [bacterium]